MSNDKIKVLLVEDNPADARLVQELLKEVEYAPFDIEWVDRLEDALERLGGEEYGAILLDLSLPDSRGLDSLMKVHERVPQVPTIVLTGMEEETLALTAVQEGAHDYLVKSLLDSKQLVRTLCYAIERNRMLTELEQARVREQHDRELAAMNEAVCAFQTDVDASGIAPMNDTHKDVFDGLIDAYGALLDAALERRAYDAEHDITARLQEMAGQVGAVKGGPCDVAQIHLAALAAKRKAAPPTTAQAYFEEGSRLIVELMGHLVAYYRH